MEWSASQIPNPNVEASLNTQSSMTLTSGPAKVVPSATSNLSQSNWLLTQLK